MTRCVIAAAVILAVTVAGAARAQEQSRAIFEGFIGKTLLLETPGGTLEALYKPDGSATMSGPMADKGRWRWDDSGQAFCVKWQKFRGGVEGCFVILQVAGEYFVTPKGSNDVTTTVRIKL